MAKNGKRFHISYCECPYGKDYSRAKEIIGISQASRMKRCLEAGVPYVE